MTTIISLIANEKENMKTRRNTILLYGNEIKGSASSLYELQLI